MGKKRKPSNSQAPKREPPESQASKDLKALRKQLESAKTVGVVLIGIGGPLWKIATDAVSPMYIAGSTASVFAFWLIRRWRIKPGLLSWVVLVSGLLLNHFLIYPLIRPEEKPSFAVTVKTTHLSSTETAPLDYWMTQRRGENEFLCPIPFLLYLQFTNLKTNPVRIDSYSLRLKNGINEPFTPPTIDLRDGKVYRLFNLGIFTNACEIDIPVNDFSSMIAGRNIGPGDTVEGWVGADFFGWPGFGKLEFFDLVSQKRHSVDINIRSSDDEGGLQVNAPGYTILAVTNISHFSKLRFSELPPQIRVRSGKPSR